MKPKIPACGLLGGLDFGKLEVKSPRRKVPVRWSRSKGDGWIVGWREKVFMDWNFGNCKVEWKAKLCISSRGGNWRQMGRARTVESKHRRPIDGWRVPSLRWRSMLNKRKRGNGIHAAWKRRTWKRKEEMWKMEWILVYNSAILGNNPRRLEWKTTGLDGNYLTEWEKRKMWIYKKEIHVCKGYVWKSGRVYMEWNYYYYHQK